MITLNISKEKDILQSEVNNWFQRSKDYFDNIPDTLIHQIRLMNKIRLNIYEDLNQLQHKALLISAAEELQNTYPQIDKWSWYPKQTSHPEYADLTGYIGEAVFLNAEATTSNRPVGTIDKRMMTTLLSLNQKQGLKFYFVQTDEMYNRAKSKVINNNFGISVIKI